MKRHVIGKLTVAILGMVFVLSASHSTLRASATPELADPAHLAQYGLHYDAPKALTLPVVRRHEAIEAARNYIGPIADMAKRVHAQHVLFTDDNYFGEDSQGNKQYRLQRVSAWAVTFQGVEYRVLQALHSEVTVIIDAASGQVLESFAFR